MTFPLWVTFAVLFILIFFSVWCFILNFKSSWVCTTKDLVTTFVSGGALAVVVMVFGVTGDIKHDTGRIFAAVTGSGFTNQSRNLLSKKPTRPEVIEVPALDPETLERIDDLVSEIGRIEDSQSRNSALIQRLVMDLRAKGLFEELVYRLEGSLEQFESAQNQLAESFGQSVMSDRQVPMDALFREALAQYKRLDSNLVRANKSLDQVKALLEDRQGR